ncbi:antiviral reverse transcriptase Drt3a [Priestia sp. YIM B13486]|uniref:antiviral reverse transcriptase Drt3a n=1 Tax=Priestia sp. YIM B13486 TaxID=3366304 RepID=UPI003672A83A
MKYQLDRNMLEDYYSTLYKELKTGNDRITPQKFYTIRAAEFDLILRKVNDKSYSFTSLKKVTLSTNREVYIPTIRDRLVIEYLKDKIKQKYRVVYPSRNEIIKSIVSKFNFDMEYYVIRLDIKDFFNSLPQNVILSKIKEKSLLSAHEYHLLKELLKKVEKGLPQGLSVSNALAEIYMERFDQELKRIHPRMNYYCRYVDDILLIFNGNLVPSEISTIKNKIHTIFKRYSLEINKKKNKFKFTKFPLINNNTKEDFYFTYLGYKFLIKKNKLLITISEEKVNKYKDKIAYCFHDFLQNRNLDLLINRLDFLTKKNAVIKREKFLNKMNQKSYSKKKIYFGIMENYKYIHEDEKINIAKIIDDFLISEINKVKYILNSNQYGFTNKEKKRLYSISLSHNMDKLNPIYRYKKVDYIKKILGIKYTESRKSLDDLTYDELSKEYFKLLRYDYLLK